MLDEIYKEARMRLQMCQSNLLLKFNDRKNKIFNVLKGELEETVARLRQAANAVIGQQQ